MQELLGLIRAEVEALQPELEASLDAVGGNDDTECKAFEIYAEQVGRIAEVAEMTGLFGMQQVCNQVLANVQLFIAERQHLDDIQRHLLDKWPLLLNEYLLAPLDPESCEPLVSLLQNCDWPMPLADSDAEAIFSALQTLPDDEDQEGKQERQETAKPEDVLLRIDDQVNPQVYESFLQEAPTQLTDISINLMGYLRNQDQNCMQAAQRAVHTLKGAAATAGVAGILNIAHHLEDIFDIFVNQTIHPSRAVSDVILEASDCLESMVEHLTGLGPAPDNSVSVLQKILDIANLADRGDLDQYVGDSETTAEPEPDADLSPTEYVSPDRPVLDQEVKQTLRVPVDAVAELLQVSGELTVLGEHMKEQLKQVLRHLQGMNQHSNQMAGRVNDLETLIDIKGVPFLEKSFGRNPQNKTDEGEFDPLEMDQYNELHSHTRSFAEAVTDTRELGMVMKQELQSLEKLLQEQAGLQQGLQQQLLTTRMLPASSISQRLQRCVRQACRDTAKQVSLLIEGENILLDSEVLNRAVDPLMHILRNAVDHGIEVDAERFDAGKPLTGTIRLSFKREGNNILIRCQDDGQGLNLAAIRLAAIQRGLLAPEEEPEAQVLERLVLQSGFSSRNQVTKVSGRGVGMDVVHRTILDMKGSMEVESDPGVGLSIILRIPITLISMNLLIVEIENTFYAIPSPTVVKSLAGDQGRIEKLGQKWIYQLDQDTWPVVALSELVGRGKSTLINKDKQAKPAVLVRTEDGTHAISVDRIIDNRENVLKNFGNYLPKVDGVSGAVVMGDGKIVPVLDIPELLREPSVSLPEAQTQTAAVINHNQVKILIVEDSLSARRSLAQLVNDSGYTVETATDGLEALNVMEKYRPDVVLSDMEMPRMNGLELAAHLRAKTEFSDIPVIMITSRHTDKHRQQALRSGVNYYLTKPYSETDVLDRIEQAVQTQSAGTQEQVA